MLVSHYLPAGTGYADGYGAIGVGLGIFTQYLQLAASAGLDWAKIEPLSEAELERLLVNGAVLSAAAGKRIEPDCAWIHRELRRKGVTLQLLWEEYVGANPGQKTLRYTQFCQRYKDWAQTLKRSMLQQHYAGEKLFADFAGQTVPILDRAGGVAFKAHIFVTVLGASNYTYACATRSEATPDWIGGFIDAMEFCGGVPRLLVPDNPRALISNADRYEPTLGLFGPSIKTALAVCTYGDDLQARRF